MGKKSWKRWLKYHYIKVVRINDSPEKVAGGLALGVVIGILPTLGLGILIAAFTAGFFRVNRVSAVIGTFIMNPWTATFFWAASYIVGSLALGQNLTDTVSLVRTLRTHKDLWENILAHRLLTPYIIGNVMVTTAAAAVSYLSCLYLVRAYRRSRYRIKTRHSPQPGPGDGPR